MRDSNKEISIIIPVYNAEKTIERCINSILNQTIIDQMEVILVDDSSNDNSLSIMRKYEKENKETVKVIQQQNSGPAVARNNGIKMAKGKYIGFVDADDYIDEKMYEKMQEKMKIEDVDLVLIGRYNVLRNGQMKEKINNRCISGMSLKDNPEILSKMSTFVWDKLYKKSIIEKHNIVFPEGFHYAEDLYFLTKYKYYANKISVIKEPLYYYVTQSKNSITNVCNERWLDIIKILNETNKFFIEKGEFQKYKNELLKISMGFFCRRVREFKNCNNKKMQVLFIKEFYKYFTYYFENWKNKLQMYGVQKAKKYRTNLKLMKAYIYSPNILKKIIGCTKRVYKRIKTCKVYYAYCRKRYKVKENQVLFLSYYGGNITDSPYYMMKELSKDKNFKIYVASRQPVLDRIYLDFNKLSNVKIVKVHSKEFVKLLSTAKYIVNNSRIPEYVIKKKNQILVNTWHGTPLKTLGRRMNKGLSDLGNNQTQFLMSDYLLYPNEYTKKHIMEDFCLDNLFAGKVIVSGYPRNEIFLSKNRSKEIRERNDLEGKRVYLYMPTWRGNTLDTTNIKKYKEEIESILEEIDNKVEDNVVIFVKLHQIVMKHIKLTEYKHIRNVNSFYETYEFLNIADGLITDYSSVFFDYANSKKEIILFMYDYGEYMADRGMYMDIKKLPFTKIYNTQQLIEHINSSTEFIITNEYKNFLNEYCKFDSKENSKIVNDIIFRRKVKLFESSRL